jgi:hypothetical protein
MATNGLTNVISTQMDTNDLTNGASIKIDMRDDFMEMKDTSTAGKNAQT